MQVINRRIAETDRIHSERLARIETLLLEHNRILSERNRILQVLLGTIHEKMDHKLPNRPHGHDGTVKRT
jgi:hypothetical protein